MKQVFVKSGKAVVEEVPVPLPAPGMALVRVVASLISSGTESGFFSEGGALGYLLKKASDPRNVEKVKRKLATVGFKGTLDIVRNKVLEPQAPGYSSAGVIIELGPDTPFFHVGDRVACSGVGYACHAEYNAVPHPLLTPIPDPLSFEEAAFVSLGAIALQGVRRAQPTLGETFVVIGLGLIGQLVVQILRAGGCHVIGCDVVPSRRELAKELGADVVGMPDQLEGIVQEETAGYGADGVLICAASKESGITNHALRLCRSRGRVVIIGAVGMHLERESMYANELDFLMSCSYGPGRYNPLYEERGLDYPIGYVRWTQGRNMSEFLRMASEKKVCLTPLITVREPVERAESAYDMVLRGGQTIAAILQYGAATQSLEQQRMVRRLNLSDMPKTKADISIAIIGAGAIATGHHLPNLKRIPGCSVRAIATRSGIKAKQLAKQHGTAYCTTDYREVLADDGVDAVVIATRHHIHKEIALAAIEAGKHVFVEKPLALTADECEEICTAAMQRGVLLTVGFNRRFAPLAIEAKQLLKQAAGSVTLLYRCNAGTLPANHWVFDPIEGGGRIRGEAVHFFDFARWLLEDDPVDIQAVTLRSEIQAYENDSVSVLLRFRNGSQATIVYCGMGSSAMPKERIEIFRGGISLLIDDFKTLSIYDRKCKTVSHRYVNKGLYELMAHFVAALQGKEVLSVTGEDGRWATFIAEEALRKAEGAAKPLVER